MVFCSSVDKAVAHDDEKLRQLLTFYYEQLKDVVVEQLKSDLDVSLEVWL